MTAANDPRFEKLVDLVVDAPANAPISIEAAARAVRMPYALALAYYLDLYDKFSEPGRPDGGDALLRRMMI